MTSRVFTPLLAAALLAAASGCYCIPLGGGAGGLMGNGMAFGNGMAVGGGSVVGASCDSCNSCGPGLAPAIFETPRGAQAPCGGCGPGFGCGGLLGLGWLAPRYCGDGCGDYYVHPWVSDPPDMCDPCDGCGAFVGDRCCPPRYRGLLSALWGCQNCEPVQRCGLVLACMPSQVGTQCACGQPSCVACCGYNVECNECEEYGHVVSGGVMPGGMVVGPEIHGHAQPVPMIVPGSPADKPEVLPPPQDSRIKKSSHMVRSRPRYGLRR